MCPRSTHASVGMTDYAKVQPSSGFVLLAKAKSKVKLSNATIHTHAQQAWRRHAYTSSLERPGRSPCPLEYLIFYSRALRTGRKLLQRISEEDPGMALSQPDTVVPWLFLACAFSLAVLQPLLNLLDTVLLYALRHGFLSSLSSWLVAVHLH